MQRQRADETVRASFKDLSTANAFSLAVSAAWAAGGTAPTADRFAIHPAGVGTERAPSDDGASRRIAEDAPTRLDELVALAIESHRADKHLDSSVPDKMRGQWGKRGGFFGNPDIRFLTRPQVREFARHLYEQRLSRVTANEYLRLVRMACAYAIEAKVITSNVATGVVGRHQDNPLRPHPVKQPKALTPAQAKALAAQFEPWLRVSIFLMYVGCLRLSEAFGIEIRDWDPVAQTLKVRRQGGLAKNEGKRDPYRPDEAEGRLKNRSSRRTIPIPPMLGEVIDLHIAVHHGARPDDLDAAAEWEKTRLISTAAIPKPLNTALDYRWDDALATVGLDFASVGYRVNRQFLRSSGSTFIGVGNLRGKLWSGYMGHATPVEFGGSLTTVRHYFDLPDEELIAVADHWQELLTDAVGDLQINEEWWSSPHVTIKEAAMILGVHATHVGWLLRRGLLEVAPDVEVGGWRRQAGVYRCSDRIMISGSSLHAEAERRRRQQGSLTETDTARELGVSPHHVRALRARGLLTAEQAAKGGPWSYDRDTVADMSTRLEEERAEAGKWVSLGEAARTAGLAQSEFARTHGRTARTRVLVLNGQVEYLRRDVQDAESRETRRNRY